MQHLYLSYFMDSGTPLYGGGKGIKVSNDRSIKNGDTANTKQLSFQNHSGTHIDFPNHFFEDGLTSEFYSADQWFFYHPHLLMISSVPDEIILLSEEQLDAIPKNTDFLIIKTGFGQYRNEEKYWRNNPGFSPLLADHLRKRLPELKVIGMDIISITSYQNREIGREAHRNFLGGERPLLLVEDMDLSKLVFSPAQVLCFPLLIRGLDGAPVTAVAIL